MHALDHQSIYYSPLLNTLFWACILIWQDSSRYCCWENLLQDSYCVVDFT